MTTKNTTRRITEAVLVEQGFTKHLMAGTGYVSINSMQPAKYYYENGRVAINATEIWTWFLDGKQRNDIAVNSEEDLIQLLVKYSETKLGDCVEMKTRLSDGLQGVLVKVLTIPWGFTHLVQIVHGNIWFEQGAIIAYKPHQLRVIGKIHPR